MSGEYVSTPGTTELGTVNPLLFAKVAPLSVEMLGTMMSDPAVFVPERKAPIAVIAPARGSKRPKTNGLEPPAT